ncbi:putative ribonuclease H-like domain-containing protein [Tanacetum coccineum]
MPFCQSFYNINEVIEFGDSYKEPGKAVAGEASAKKKGMIVVITTKDMQKRRNDVKARTTLYKDKVGMKIPDWMILEEMKNTKHYRMYANVFGLDVPTASSQVSTVSTEVAAASLSHDTICANIATQSSGSQIKYEDISQIDEDDIEEMDIKWNLALLSMRADRFWKKTGKKITIQGSDVAGFDKSKVECFNYHKMGHFARNCMAKEDENHALVTDDVVPTEFALMAMSSSSSDNEIKFCERIRVPERDLEIRDNKIENLRNELKEVKKEKESIDFKIEKFGNASKDLNDLLKSEKSAKDKTGVGFNEYTIVPPPPTQVYSPPKNDLSWTGLPEFVDDTVTDYTRPTPSVDVSKDVRSDLDGNNTSIFEQGETSGSNMLRPMIKFVKESGCPNAIKINNTENTRKPL